MSYSAGLNILEPPQVINRERIQELINSFSSIGASENGSVSRRGFSDEDIYARNFFMKTLKELGLKIRIDTAGNIIARLDGHDNNLPPIVTGSHLDTVPKGGKYDGTLGVIAGIEIAFFLQENDIKLNRPDTLRAIQMYFPQMGDSTNNIPFKLTIWKNISNNTIFFGLPSIACLTISEPIDPPAPVIIRFKP